jgi:hypothetical protein
VTLEPETGATSTTTSATTSTTLAVTTSTTLPEEVIDALLAALAAIRATFG